METTSPFEPRIIKRYRNRKFYDTAQSRYLRLEELAEVVEGGTDVRVLEHETSRDITRATLFALLGLRRRAGPSIGERGLHDLVRGALLPEVARGREAPGPGAGDPAPDPGRGPAEERLAEIVARGARARERAEALWRAAQASLGARRAELQKQLAQAWSVVSDFGKLNRELGRLRAGIDEIGERLDRLERGSAAGGRGEAGPVARRA